MLGKKFWCRGGLVVTAGVASPYPGHDPFTGLDSIRLSTGGQETSADNGRVAGIASGMECHAALLQEPVVHRPEEESSRTLTSRLWSTSQHTDP